MDAYYFLILGVGIILSGAYVLYFSKRKNILNKRQLNQQSLDKYLNLNNNKIKNINNKITLDNDIDDVSKTDLNYLKNASKDQIKRIISEEI